MAWGTEIMALGNLRRGARPAIGGAGTGHAGMGPEPWASYPGSGGPMEMVEYPAGSGPQWRTNFITSQPSSIKVPNGGPTFGEGPIGASAGKRIYGTVMGLGLPPMLVNLSTNQSSFTMGRRTRRLGGPLASPCEVGVGGVSVADYWRYRSHWLTAVGAAVGAYHGYNRSKESSWAMLGWGLAGALFPVLVTGVALVQGVGKSR